MAFFAYQRQQTLADWRNDHVTGRISVTAEGGGLKVNSPYDAAFVAELKTRIPATARKWDNTSKAWYVAPAYADELKSLIEQCYGVTPVMPTVMGVDNSIFEITFQADYIANSKKIDGSVNLGISSVHANGSWSAKIPESVLRKWFNQAEAQEAANAPQTYYAVLGCPESAKPEEIKKAFKRAARQWHPDICREPNAREMFERVKEASEILLDTQSRARYDAGLAFEKMAKQSTKQRPQVSAYATYIPMLRCGQLTVRARRELGILIVEEILAWDDITNEFGQTMISFWAGENFSVMWV